MDLVKRIELLDKILNAKRNISETFSEPQQTVWADKTTSGQL